MANSADPDQKPTDLDLHRLQRQGISGFSMTRVNCKILGPVVQSVVTCSLTSSLRVILLTVLADSIYNIMIFFAEKM